MITLVFSWCVIVLSSVYSQLTFARFYIPAYLPEAEKAIYLDDDIVVQGEAATFHSKMSAHVTTY